MFKNILNKFNKKRRNSFFIEKKKKKNIFKKRKLYNLNIWKIINYFSNIINTKIIYFSLIWIIFSLILFLIFGPFLKVKKIEILKTDYITNLDIAYKSIDNIREKSLFFLDFDNIKQNLKTYQKNIDKIWIKLILPNTIEITLSSYLDVFNTNINWKNYIVTENWVLVPNKTSPELKNIEIFHNKINKISILDYKKVFKTKYIKNINYLIYKLEENILNLKIDNLKYYKNERELHIVSNSWINMIFDLNSDIDYQIKSSVIFNKEHYSISKWWLVYIDFRIKNKIYYCSEEIINTCISHLKRLYPY